MANLRKDIISGEVRLNASPAQKELNELARNTTQVEKATERLRQEKTRLQLAHSKDKEAIKRVNEEIKKNNLTIKQNKYRMEGLQKQIGLTALSKTQLAKKSRQLARQLDNTSKAANPSEYRRLSKELKAVNGQLNKVKRGASSAQRFLSSAKSFGAGMLGAFSVGAIVTGVANLTKSLFKLSMQMEGESRRANIVFGESLGYVEKEASKLSKRMGITKNEFIAAASATADLLIPIGFTREQSSKLAVDLQSLTGALDEWTSGQVGAKQISEILTKAMLGENEQLKQLGIAIRKDSDEFRDLVEQKLKTTNATKAQAEAMATLELIQKKSADAQRAYLTEGNKLLRTQKQLSLWWRNTKESVVEYFNVPKSQKLEEEKIKLNQLTNALIAFNENQDDRKYYIDQIQKSYPDFFKNMDIEKMKIEEIRDRLKEVNKEYETKIHLAVIEEDLVKVDKQATIEQRKVREAKLKVDNSDKNLIAQYQKGDMTLDELRGIATKRDTKTIPASGGNGDASVAISALFQKNENVLLDYVNAQEKFLIQQEERAKLLEEKFSISPEQTDVKDETAKSTGTTSTSSKVVPSSDKTAEQVNEWKEKAKELLAEAQIEIEKARIEAMDEGYEKQKAKENQRWEEEKARLEARRIEKAENQNELLPEQIKANEATNRLIEEKKQAHFDKLTAMEEAYEEDKRNKKIEAELLRLDEEMIKAEEDDIAFEEKMALAQERYELEFELAQGSRQKELQAQKDFNNTVDKIQEAQQRKERARKQATENLAQGLYQSLSKMAKKGSALAKALFLFEQAMAIRNVIINTQIANSKAIAASPLTAGMPWVAINSAIGATSVGLILGQTVAEFKGKEEGGYIDVSRAQDGKRFRAKYKPSHRGYTDGPTVITGENGMEFVANAQAAQNPTVRPFLDLIDQAQRNGTISTLNLSNVRAMRPRGYENGGYINQQHFEDVAIQNNQKHEERYAELMELVKRLAERPIEFSLLKFNEAQAEKEEIDNDINR